MEQYIFRAKQKTPVVTASRVGRVATKEETHPWIEGAYYQDKNTGKAHIIQMRRCIPDTRDWDVADDAEKNPVFAPVAIEVIPDTVCMYAGLSACWMAYDNEPQEVDIWEHDVLEFKTDLDDKTGVSLMAEVAFDASAGGFILVSDSFEDGYAPLSMFIEVEDGVPFIDAENLGNIDEIPDFVKEDWIGEHNR